MANNDLTIELIKDAIETVVQREVGGLRSEIHTEINSVRADIDGAVASIVAAFGRHMGETDAKFMSDRKRIERLEKIVLY